MFGDFVADPNAVKLVPATEKKEPKQSSGWYKVKEITGHRIVKERMQDKVELEVYWEGYAEPSWEGFQGFVKDTSVKVERYLVKN
jgi:hypothetical protein